MTRIVVDVVLESLRRGADPRGITVLTHSNESATRLRREIAHQLPHVGFVSQGSLVRSVQAFALAIVRQADAQARMLSGAEQDQLIRSLLQDHAARDGGSWPAAQREALGFVGFARALRDFVRCAHERGLTPERLDQLGVTHERPLWCAAGEFLREYDQTMREAGFRGYSAAEVVPAAVRALEADSELLAAVRAPLRALLIDDAQHLDPYTAKLVRLLMPADGLSVLAGHPAQSVFRSRGARPDLLDTIEVDHEITVTEPLLAPEKFAVVADTPGTQISVVADALRRAHLLEGVPWQDMAVIVRTPGQLGGARRGLLAAGVPVHLDPGDVVLAEQRVVTSLMLGLCALHRELTGEELEELALGPVGGADPVTLRRLLRGLRQGELASGGQRRALEVFADLVLPSRASSWEDSTQADTQDPPADPVIERLSEGELAVLDRIRTVLRAGFSARNQPVEEALWALWDATGLEHRLSREALHGGARGARADRDLDVVMALFDAASEFSGRVHDRAESDTDDPGAEIAEFVQQVQEQESAIGVRQRRGGQPEAVPLLTVHAAGGRHWHTVCVMGVQEGVWPQLGTMGGLFGQEELVALVDDDIDPNHPRSRAVEHLNEERCLFAMACTRAEKKLLVTAVESPDSHDVMEPSRFLEELGVPVAKPGDQVRVLSVPSVIAELRRAVSDGGLREGRRRQAAWQLARLAHAGVFGAHPEQWWGQCPPIDAALVDPSEPAVLSPSRIEAIAQCPLKATLGNLETEEDTPIHLLRGTLVHAFAEAVARGVDAQQAQHIVTQAYSQLLNEPAWKLPSTLEEWDHLLSRTNLWLATSRSVYTQVGVEIPLQVEVGATADGQPVIIRGRMDRLEREASGALVVVDLKTGTTMPSNKTMSEHAQLAAYQLALSRGVVDGARVRTARTEEKPAPVGGGLLVFPAPVQAKVPVRMQAPLSDENLDELAATLPHLALEIRGPQLPVRVNETCTHCSLRPVCPLQPEGRMTTHV